MSLPVYAGQDGVLLIRLPGDDEFTRWADVDHWELKQEQAMKFKDVEADAKAKVEKDLRDRAERIIAQRHAELVQARQVVSRLEKEYQELLDADVEELMHVPVGGQYDPTVRRMVTLEEFAGRMR